MKKFSNFSIILSFIALSIIGLLLSTKLVVEYIPNLENKTLTITYNWYGASAKVIEMNVTSILEGKISTINGINKVSSISRDSNGEITINFKKEIDIDFARFEVNSAIREVYSSLPNGVSYPTIVQKSSIVSNEPAIIYSLSANTDIKNIEEYINDIIIPIISGIDGVADIEINSNAVNLVDISYNTKILNKYKLSVDDISLSLNQFIKTKENISIDDINNITIKIIDNKPIYLKDICKLTLKEKNQNSYYRVNGLNSISFSIYPEQETNIILLCNSVKAELETLQKFMPQSFNLRIVKDSSRIVSKELQNVTLRTLLSLLILLSFIYLTNRNIKFLLIILFSLCCNLLITIGLCSIFSVHINIYSISAFTISLGIIIDTSIIMASHYVYYKNRKIISAIFAALLTTIAALSIVKILPEEEQLILLDFSLVIILNLIVSLFISTLLIPSMIEYFKESHKRNKINRDKYKGYLLLLNKYKNLLLTLLRYRYVCLFITLIIFGFTTYNHLNNKRGSFSMRSFENPTLYIRCSLEDGHTIKQLNNVIKEMELFLSNFNEISLFTTNVYPNLVANITVTFKDNIKNKLIPLYIKQALIDKATSLSSAEWAIFGIDDSGYSNSPGITFKPNRIEFTGYNYDMVYNYCNECLNILKNNKRVKNADIYGYVDYGGELKKKELSVEYNSEYMSRSNISKKDIHNVLNDILYKKDVAECHINGEKRTLRLINDEGDNYSLWSLKNEPIKINNCTITLGNAISILEKDVESYIYKEQMQYKLVVAYDYIDSKEESKRFITNIINSFNNYMPLGFKANTQKIFANNSKTNYLLIFVIIIIILYFTCSILFESLLSPLIIIAIIPLSLPGFFASLQLSGAYLDQGALAAFVVLSGIVVNASIYLLHEYKICLKSGRGFIKAIENKLIPILLTIISTILGLFPFLIEGPELVFWFSFAIATIGGLISSVFVLIFIIPLFIKELKL